MKIGIFIKSAVCTVILLTLVLNTSCSKKEFGKPTQQVLPLSQAKFTNIRDVLPFEFVSNNGNNRVEVFVNKKTHELFDASSALNNKDIFLNFTNLFYSKDQLIMEDWRTGNLYYIHLNQGTLELMKLPEQISFVGFDENDNTFWAQDKEKCIMQKYNIDGQKIKEIPYYNYFKSKNVIAYNKNSNLFFYCYEENELGGIYDYNINEDRYSLIHSLDFIPEQHNDRKNKPVFHYYEDTKKLIIEYNFKEFKNIYEIDLKTKKVTQFDSISNKAFSTLYDYYNPVVFDERMISILKFTDQDVDFENCYPISTFGLSEAWFNRLYYISDDELVIYTSHLLLSYNRTSQKAEIIVEQKLD